ncbi:CD209 antigen [Oryzias melastigma]|uniref:CD209 antigen-like n=1 Tax=Oryzias melastigma TaxID=30732 RepID=A0A3B3CU76_ORYME|nr:CD209 antigen [Oryzias melastigma]
MADEKIIYASVTFRPTTQFRFKAEREEVVYDEVKVSHENLPGPDGGLLQDEDVGIKSRLTQLFHRGCGIRFGFLILVFIIGLSVYIALSSVRGTDELIQWRTNQTKLLENSQNQTRLHNALLSDYENLRKDHTDLNKLWRNLNASFMDLQNKIQNISAENQQLEIKNEELKKENVNLKLEKDDMEAECEKLNVSRAQWSVDNYCPKPRGKQKRECRACLKDWTHENTKCYEVKKNKAVTWREAQQDCEGKNSQLLLVDKLQKLKLPPQFWIGLRVENGKWKWINGSTLSQSINPVNGRCAVSFKDKDWKSVDCNNKN